MGSFSEDDECRFFDAQEDVLSIADDEGVSNAFDYGLWIRSPRSVRERKGRFMKSMGLSSMDLTALGTENSVDVGSVLCEEGNDRVEFTSGSVTRNCVVEEEFCSSRTSMSCLHREDSSEELGLVDNSPCGNENLEGNVDQEGLESREMSDGRDLDSDRLVVMAEPKDSGNGFRETDANASVRRTKGWFRKLRSISCMVNSHGEGDFGRGEGLDEMPGCRLPKVKVRQSKKPMKELSALYMRQDIKAHEGSILTMKFSPDGQYLASGGEDGVVRLWQVVEEDRCNEVDIPEIDPSCIYFTVNNLSELTPLFIDKEKISKLKNLKKTSDSACVVFPPKIFRLLEKPLREFHGHRGEVLDLSWSNNNYLLSSSVDKTVRLWQVNNDRCLKVFSHSNYVTCIQFNPVDDNYFISGSIDGKVRIWAISDCHVVDWISIKDIVTAVCYRPDGQGGIIGSLAGNCRFYNVSENRLQLDSQLCLIGKKKLVGRGITGFRFLPQDSNKVMVSCADSQVRILDGLNVIGKYKSLSTGSPICASFTSDGKHILSACEDSNVYLWNVSEEESSNPVKAKKITSCERFCSNASVAVPWHGLKSKNIENKHQLNLLDKGSSQVIQLNPPASFSLSQEFVLESFSKGSATWPEEKLPVSSSKVKTSLIHQSEYNFLMSSCKSTSSAHAWGMVIVTAGWDGRIKAFHNYGLPIPV
ncbi:WD repeat-containing protein 44-like [Vigna umbellata]|uniref:WD repeat-containing protein 44-like n=1 Tax=Vigna umbellata TaxID=87088 RepID=UPI001F5ECA46|nr:WD repeat-containing protein 44-like [Vigna umbellata]